MKKLLFAFLLAAMPSLAFGQANQIVSVSLGATSRFNAFPSTYTRLEVDQRIVGALYVGAGAGSSSRTPFSNNSFGDLEQAQLSTWDLALGFEFAPSDGDRWYPVFKAGVVRSFVSSHHYEGTYAEEIFHYSSDFMLVYVGAGLRFPLASNNCVGFDLLSQNPTTDKNETRGLDVLVAAATYDFRF